MQISCFLSILIIVHLLFSWPFNLIFFLSYLGLLNTLNLVVGFNVFPPCFSQVYSDPPFVPLASFFLPALICVYLLEHDPTPRTILWLVLSTTNSSFYSDTFLLWLSSVNSSTLTSRREAIFLRLRVQNSSGLLAEPNGGIYDTSKHWPLYLCRNAS